MTRPRLLDLFCGAGGAAVGYHRAGFEVVGVDNRPQPNYPFEFIQADATTFLELLDSDLYAPIAGFDVVHASPPCQRYNKTARQHGHARAARHPDLVGVVRSGLAWWGGIGVIENVPGSPLVEPFRLCGSSFGLGVRRHRLFECPVILAEDAPACRHEEQGRPVGVYGNPGGSSKRDGIKFGGVEKWREAMGIDWMTVKELSQAIPPAYTEWIGRQLLDCLAWWGGR